MKKSLIALALTFGYNAIATNYVVINPEHNKFTQVVAEIPQANSSCKDILDNGESIGDGVYTITNGSKDYSVYCNMTDFGGGWTLVVSQYEVEPVSWNEGIQSDYDPDFAQGKSFTLNTEELPEHTESAFTQYDNHGKSIHQYFTTEYSTGDIAVKTITTNSGVDYMIHRSFIGNYNGNNPEEAFVGGNTVWSNTLTVDQNGGRSFSYVFCQKNPTVYQRGYGANGPVYGTYEDGAWLVWVR